MYVRVKIGSNERLYECRSYSTCHRDGKLEITLNDGEPPTVLTLDPEESVILYAMNDRGKTVDTRTL